MGKPRKPTKVLELSGAFKKNPQRKRNQEPAGQGELGDPPPHLGDAQRVAWLEIATTAYWLTGTDRIAVEVAAGLMARSRTDPDFRGYGHLLSALGKLGLSPVDRNKIEMPEAPTTSRWDK